MMDTRMERTSSPEQKKELFHFSELEWKTCEPGAQFRENRNVEYIATSSFEFGGEHFTLTAAKTQRVFNENAKKESLFIYVDWNDRPAYKGYVTLDADADNQYAEAGIGKLIRGEPKLRLGLGRELYFSLLAHIQHEANIQNRPILHEVSRSEDYPAPNLGLTPEQWNQTFPPLLRERGYHVDDEGIWTKSYHPEAYS